MSTSADTDTSIQPGWPEMVAGVLGLAICGVGAAVYVAQLDVSPVVIGLVLAALSGIGGMAGFLAALLLRIRSPRAFGVRPTTVRWLMLGAGWGVIAFFAKSLSILAYVSITGDSRTPQDIYATGASGGIWTVIAATFLIGVGTPIGEDSCSAGWSPQRCFATALWSV